MTHSTTAAPIRGLRRAAIIAAIASLTIAALVGIVTILSGEWGETQSRIMGTTLIVGAFSIVALADLTVAGRRVRWVGWVGVLVSAVAAVTAILMVWNVLDAWNEAFKLLLSSVVVSIAIAAACLLLLFEGRRHPLFRWGLPLTLALIAASAVMLLLPILTDGDIPGDNGDPYWRGFAVVLILAVLGLVVIPVAGLILRGREPGARPAELLVRVPADLREAVAARAAEQGVSPEEFVVEAVRGRLG